MDTFGTRLKALRIKSNLTQTQLSQKTGIPQTSISSYELGKFLPSIETLYIFADFFKESVEYLYFGKL